MFALTLYQGNIYGSFFVAINYTIQAEINGEVHHKPRYEKYPAILGIGVMSELMEEQTELFNNLIKRNSINLHSPTYESKIFKSDEDINSIQQSINELLNKIGDKNE